jgi:cytochrome oxidase assembly protein ShyY1
VTLPVRLHASSEEQVAGLQCDISLDATGLSYVGTEMGPAGQAADKALSANPVGRSEIRLILVGLNQNVIGEGVVADLLLKAVAEAPIAPEMAVLDDVILSDPYGARIAVTSAGMPLPRSAHAARNSAPSQRATWMALALLFLVCGMVFAVTRAAQRSRKPRHARRLQAKHRRESKSC